MKQIIQKIAEYIKNHSKADDYVLNLRYTDSYDCRFAQNSISHHIAGDNIRIRYTAYIDKKVASSEVNQYDEASLQNLIENTEAAAKLNQPDPEYTDSMAKRDFPAFDNVCPSTLNFTPNEAVELIKQAISFAVEKNCLLSGIFSKEYSISHISTGKGFSGIFDACSYAFSMTMKKEDKETKLQLSGKDISTLDLKTELEKFYLQFSSLDSPKSMEPEKLNVILRPVAVANLFMFLGWIMDRKMADEGITPFTGKIGEQFFGKNFNLFTTSSHDEMIRESFNNYSVFKDIEWIKDGVINHLPVSKSHAAKIGEDTSSLFNMYIPGGDTEEAEMMKMAGRGIIINNFWYIRTNDMKTADFTGMTRDGVLYFENGEIKHSVNNFRFNECIPDVTRRILAMGKSVLCYDGFKIPTMLISDFNFVDKTNF
jgi:predicted Zn-dependent protease